jgi:ParB family chromosome partitioning protein
VITFNEIPPGTGEIGHPCAHSPTAGTATTASSKEEGNVSALMQGDYAALSEQGVVPPTTNVERIAIDDVVIPAERRVRNEEMIAVIAASMNKVGQLSPIIVRRATKELVAGRTRIESARLLGRTDIDCIYSDGDDVRARLEEIAENLHRGDLTVLDRSEQTAEWVKLTDVASVSGPQGGTAKAARELPVPGKTEGARRKDMERALKIAGISAEAKSLVRDSGLEDNQSALLAIASAKTPEEQIEKARKRVERHRHPPSARKRPHEADVDENLGASASGATTQDQEGAKAAATQLDEMEPSTEAERGDVEDDPSDNAADAAPAVASVRPTQPAERGDDLEIPARFDRRDQELVKAQDERHFAAMRAAWDAAPDLKSSWTNASRAARERFAAEVLGFTPASDGNL